MSAIRVELQLSDGSFTTGLLRAGQSLEQFNKQLQKTHPHMATLAGSSDLIYKSMTRADASTQSFLGTIRDVSIVVGAMSMGLTTAGRVVNGWAGEIVKVNSEIERLKMLMASMSSAADPMAEAAANVDLLLERTRQAPFSLNTMSNAFVKLKATGIDPLGNSLDSIVDGVAAFGGSDDALNRIVLGISQMSGKGVIQMEEMRQQLSESMPRAMELMARSMGMSMADLVDAIATGRVEAKHALDSLFNELELTFGGSAQQMMTTWSGQLAQTTTQLQRLSLIAGEGFFEELKGQLRDFNEFLNSPAGEELARSIGQNMGNVVTWIRTAIDTVVEFQEQIKVAGLVIGTALGGRALFAGIDQVARGLAGLSTSYVSLMGALRSGQAAKNAETLARKANTAAIAQETAAIGAQTAAMTANAAASRFSATASVAALGAIASRVSMFAGAISGALGWVGLLGTGIYLLADHFDVFTDKTDSATEALENFSGATREEFEKVQEQGMNRILELTRYAQDIDDLLNNPTRLSHNLHGSEAENRAYIEQLKARAEAYRAEAQGIAELIGAAEERFTQQHVRAQTRILMDGVEAQLDAQQTAWDNERKAKWQHYTELQGDTADGERNIQQIKDEFQAAMYQDELAFYDQRIALLDGMHDEAVAAAEQTTGDERKVMQAHADALTGMLVSLYEKRDALVERGPNTISLLGAAEVDNSVFEDAEKHLTSLNDKIANIGAGGNSTTAILVRLARAINDQNFGSVKDGEQAFKRLARQILEASRQQEALDRVVDGRKDFNDRLSALLDENETRLWRLQREAQGLTATDLDELQWRLNRGEFEGLEPDSAMSAEIRAAIIKLNEMETAAAEVERYIQDDTFGPDSIQAIDETTNSVMLLRQEVQQLAGALSGVDLNVLRMNTASGAAGNMGGFGLAGITAAQVSTTGSMRDKMGAAMQFLMSKGWTREQAAGIVGNLAGESGFNTGAIGDNGTSGGLGQWHDTSPGVGRFTNLKNFAANRGTAWTDFQTQLEFLQHELETNEKGAAAQLRLAGTPEQAAESFMRNFERPAAWAMQQSGPKRAGYALEAYGLASGTSTVPTVELSQGSVEAIGETFVAPTASIREAVRTGQVETNDQANAGIEEVRRVETAGNYLEKENALIAATSDLKKAIENAKGGLPSDGMSLDDVRTSIMDGAFGDNKSVSAAEYEEILRLAQQYEAVLAEIEAKEDARNEHADQLEDLKQKEVELTRQAADLHRQLQDPNAVTESSGIRQLTDDLNEYVETARRAYGEDSAEFANAQAYKQQILSQFRMNEQMLAQQESAQRTQQINTSLMTERQQRQFAFQERIAELDAMIAAVDQSEAQGVELVRQYEAEKAAIRRQYAQEMNPMSAQMAEWSDLQGNLAKQSTQWMDSLAGGITDLIMGTGDLRSVLKGIMKDMLNSVIKYMMSGMMGGKGGAGGGAGKLGMMGGGAGKGGGAAKMGGGGMGKMFGLAHTGGIIGKSALSTKRANPSVFLGAPKFHTGGIIGGPKLLPGEVPIIAKQGEGVFTPEQMKALGGTSVNSTSVNISAPVTVNANGGTREQNEDLAKQVSRQLEGQLRGMIMQEMMQATRPGNFGNQRTK